MDKRRNGRKKECKQEHRKKTKKKEEEGKTERGSSGESTCTGDVNSDIRYWYPNLLESEVRLVPFCKPLTNVEKLL